MKLGFTYKAGQRAEIVVAIARRVFNAHFDGSCTINATLQNAWSRSIHVFSIQQHGLIGSQCQAERISEPVYVKHYITPTAVIHNVHHGKDIDDF